MLENHTGDLPLWLPGPGMGFGLGYGVVVGPRCRGNTAVRSARATGAARTARCRWIDREEEIVAVLMTQVRPYSHLNLRHDFQVLTYQAIVD